MGKMCMLLPLHLERGEKRMIVWMTVAAKATVFTLLISHGSGATRFDYATAAACERARQAILAQHEKEQEQLREQASLPQQRGTVRTIATARPTVYCVPR